MSVGRPVIIYPWDSVHSKLTKECRVVVWLPEIRQFSIVQSETQEIHYVILSLQLDQGDDQSVDVMQEEI